VLYHDDGDGERQHTVITATRGPLKGKRVVAGREQECERFYRAATTRDESARDFCTAARTPLPTSAAG
jgi:putative hydrolase